MSGRVSKQKVVIAGFDDDQRVVAEKEFIVQPLIFETIKAREKYKKYSTDELEGVQATMYIAYQAFIRENSEYANISFTQFQQMTIEVNAYQTDEEINKLVAERKRWDDITGRLENPDGLDPLDSA